MSLPTINSRLVLANLLVILGAGCSIPAPVAEMASARTAIRSVQGSDASTLAPVELDRAQTKLQRAEAAMADEDYDEARRLAEESRADAELARAKGSAIKAERSAEELDASIKVLRSELERSKAAL